MYVRPVILYYLNIIIELSFMSMIMLEINFVCLCIKSSAPITLRAEPLHAREHLRAMNPSYDHRIGLKFLMLLFCALMAVHLPVF